MFLSPEEWGTVKRIIRQKCSVYRQRFSKRYRKRSEVTRPVAKRKIKKAFIWPARHPRQHEIAHVNLDKDKPKKRLSRVFPLEMGASQGKNLEK